MQRIHPPRPEAARALECKYIEPIARLRSQPYTAGYEHWWMAPPVIEAIALALMESRFAVVDDFLPEKDFAHLEALAERLYKDGHMYRGNVDQSGSYFGDAVSDAFVNSENVPQRWGAWGNHKTFCGDCDARAPGISLLPAATDALLSRLKGVVPGARVPASLRERLRPADFREAVMVATYRGAERGRYLRHSDVGRNSVLTALYYVNRGWKPEDGGQLRLFGPGHYSTRVAYDLAPQANRLLLFWANTECPHEVLRTRRDRYAMTVWYINGKDVLSGPTGFMHTMRNLHAVAPLSVADALQRLGVGEEGARKVDHLHRAHVATGASDSDALLARLRGLGLCARCGETSAQGCQAEGQREPRWFCASCLSGDGKGATNAVTDGPR